MWWNNLISLISSRIFFLAISYYNYIHKPIWGRKKGQILQAIFYAWKLIIKPAVSEAGEGRGVAYACRHFSYICDSRVSLIVNNLMEHWIKVWKWEFKKNTPGCCFCYLLMTYQKINGRGGDICILFVGRWRKLGHACCPVLFHFEIKYHIV